MDTISVKLCMWCAMHRYCLQTALFKWAKRKRLSKSRSAQSIVDLTQALHQHLVLSLSCRARREHRVFTKLLSMVPHLMECLMESSEEESMMIGDLVCLISKFYFKNYDHCLNPLEIQKGTSITRSNDTKSLKAVVLDWIAPWGSPLHPPPSRSIKTNRGFHHPIMGALLCPAGVNHSDAECVHLPTDNYLPHLVTHIVCAKDLPVVN
jgi:hypothetical protein